MSTTQTQTVPELSIFNRVASIPLVNESLSTVHSTLIGNTFTSSPYTLAQNLSKSAYHYSEPIQIRLAPILVRADSYAIMGLDAVQSRYPAPFKVTVNDIKQDLKQRSDSVVLTAHKTIDERVRSPAYNVAQAIDQKFTPIVDYVEVAVNKLQSKNGGDAPKSPSTPDAQYQYQRAFALSNDLREQLIYFSTDQFKQLEQQSVLVQRATSTAHSISDQASLSIAAAQTKVHALSDTMLQELQRIQSSTSKLPQQVQNSLKDVSDGISDSIHDISEVLRTDLPLNEKVTKVATTVQERVNPLLAAASTRVQEILKAISSKGQEAKEQVHANGRLNESSST